MSATTTTAAPLVALGARAAAAELAAPRFRGRAKLIRELRVFKEYLSETTRQAAQRVRPGAPADEIARAILGAARDTELAARAEACQRKEGRETT
jgi:hypothetical protein